MNRAAAITVAVAVSILGTACASTSARPVTAESARTVSRDSAAVLIVGDWSFVRACGGIAGGCRTAESVTEPTRYVFRANGTVTAYRNGTEAFSATYTIAPGSASDEGDRRPVLLMGLGPATDPRPLLMSFVGRDTLLLDEGCCDRYAFEYVWRNGGT